MKMYNAKNKIMIHTLETFPYKLSLRGMRKKIENIKTEDQLFRFARNIKAFQEQGVITAPAFVKDMMHKRLDEIYKEENR